MESNATYVYVYLEGEYKRVGRLRMDEENDRVVRSLFQYDEEYASDPDAFPLDPEGLPFLERNPVFESPTSRNMFCFNDVYPDNWGQWILNAIAADNQERYSNFTWLLSGGANRIGALAFGGKDGPDFHSGISGDFIERSEIELDLLQQAVIDFQEKGYHEMDRYLRHYLASGSSVGGARPKTLLTLKNGTPAIAKFRSKGDDWNVCRIEYAVMQFANEFGLNPPATYIQNVNGKDVFVIERFDHTRAFKL